jgi:hypothetical protein
VQSQGAPIVNAEVNEKPSAVKVFRKPGLSHTPSIKGALSGNVAENKKTEAAETSNYSQYDENLIEPFTQDQLTSRWKEFMEKMADRPSLCSALSTVPEIIEDHKLLLRIGNSVQEEDIRLIKPELISWLRMTLRNSKIELTTRLERIESERTFFSDTEKLQMMMQKNPILNELKQKFNLDFGE